MYFNWFAWFLSRIPKQITMAKWKWLQFWFNLPIYSTEYLYSMTYH